MREHRPQRLCRRQELPVAARSRGVTGGHGQTTGRSHLADEGADDVAEGLAVTQVVGTCRGKRGKVGVLGAALRRSQGFSAESEVRASPPECGG